MFTKHAAKPARIMRTAAALIVVTGASLLVACGDASKSSSLTEPAAAAAIDTANPDVALDLRMDRDENEHRMQYEQVEFLGNPLVSEVTIQKANHDRYNRTQPYNTAEFGPQSLAFINAFRPNQPEVANTLGAVLYPDMLIVESSRSPATSGWLSWALANGWGGRNLKDDVVDAGLSAIFGKVISPNGAYCDNGKLPLCTDNVPANDKPFGTRFPYLASPTL
jgi:hypothetical protein